MDEQQERLTREAIRFGLEGKSGLYRDIVEDAGREQRRYSVGEIKPDKKGYGFTVRVHDALYNRHDVVELSPIVFEQEQLMPLALAARAQYANYKSQNPPHKKSRFAGILESRRFLDFVVGAIASIPIVATVGGGVYGGFLGHRLATHEYSQEERTAISQERHRSGSDSDGDLQKFNRRKDALLYITKALDDGVITYDESPRIWRSSQEKIHPDDSYVAPVVSAWDGVANAIYMRRRVTNSLEDTIDRFKDEQKEVREPLLRAKLETLVTGLAEAKMEFGSNGISVDSEIGKQLVDATKNYSAFITTLETNGYFEGLVESEVEHRSTEAAACGSCFGVIGGALTGLLPSVGLIGYLMRRSERKYQERKKVEDRIRKERYDFLVNKFSAPSEDPFVQRIVQNVSASREARAKSQFGKKS